MHQYAAEPFVRVGERRQAVPDQCATFTTSYLGHRIHFNGSSPPSRPFSSREGWKGARCAVVVALKYSLSLSLSFIVYSFTYSSSSLSLSLSISNFSATTCSSLTFNRLSVISGWYFFDSSIYPHDIYNSDGEHDTRHLAFPMHRRERIKPLG